jgi:hypothetical protein
MKNNEKTNYISKVLAITFGTMFALGGLFGFIFYGAEIIVNKSAITIGIIFILLSVVAMYIAGLGGAILGWLIGTPIDCMRDDCEWGRECIYEILPDCDWLRRILYFP